MSDTEPKPEARWGAFARDERDVVHFAVTQSAKRILEDAVADRVPADLLDSSSGAFMILSSLARQLDLVAGRPAPNDIEGAMIVAAMIAQGEAPQLAAEPEPEPEPEQADPRPVPGEFNELVGLVVDDVLVSPDQEDLYLHLTDGRVFTLRTDGDCCSISWWADVIGVRQLLGARITGFEALDVVDAEPSDPRSREEDLIYAHRLTTERGACTLVFRNSSNGYYGGSCYPMWGCTPDAGSVSITEDWSA